MNANERFNPIRIECYNCNHLFGSIFAPGCKAGEYVGDIDDTKMCNQYSPISAIGDKEIREKKGEK